MSTRSVNWHLQSAYTLVQATGLRKTPRKLCSFPGNSIFAAVRIFLSFLLAFGVLVLGCVPCSDAMNGHASEIQHKSNTKDSKEHSGDTHKDQCSPFCQCSCCTVACAMPSILVATPQATLPEAARSYSTYLQQSPSGISIPVWEPPRSL